MANPTEHRGPVEPDPTVGPHSKAADDAMRSGNDVTEETFKERAASVQETERRAQESPPPGQSVSPSHPGP